MSKKFTIECYLFSIHNSVHHLKINNLKIIDALYIELIKKDAYFSIFNSVSKKNKKILFKVFRIQTKQTKPESNRIEIQ